MMQPLKKSVLPGKNVTVYNVKLVFKITRLQKEPLQYVDSYVMFT